MHLDGGELPQVFFVPLPEGSGCFHQCTLPTVYGHIYLSSETTAKGMGFAETMGKEDPVELDEVLSKGRNLSLSTKHSVFENQLTVYQDLTWYASTDETTKIS